MHKTVRKPFDTLKVHMPKIFSFLFVLYAALAAGGCAYNPVSGTSEFVLMSESDEIRLGRTNHTKIIEEYGQYDNPRLQAYVRKIGKRVTSRSHRPGLVYHFAVLDSPDVNAFALPGGYIYITRGLLAYLNSEAELAAVLGHEAGHVTARHSVRQYTMQQTASMGFTLGSLFVPELRTRGVSDLFNLLGGVLLRGYGREHELEADRLGAEYLARNGYSPQAMIDVIRVLKNHELFEKQRAEAEGRESSVYHGLFSTHPDNDTRLKEVIGHANVFTKPGASPIVRRHEFLTELNGLVFGQGAREGVLRGNAFYHHGLDLGLTFPAGWRVKNRSDRLTARPRANDALLQVTVEDINRRISPREFIRERLKLKDPRQGASISAGDLSGYTCVVSAKTPFDLQRVRVAVIYYGDRAYVFEAAAQDEKQFNRYDPDFLATARSLHPLARAERSLAEAQRIRFIQAEGRTRYAELARKTPVLNYPVAQLRLLNGHYPRGEPRSGDWVKLVK
uniref:Zn-dependent protease n=1 Tax=Candidatus Kentrum eta TaxID=2126337 RepID=A0A450UFI7_9GAMM|nr:MAG: Putative Zn-dependent protease [Candidatus Kentron sp. H]VFJ91320.1 MAG: Putative Zn-dependent protease [Candidatus Kentron sp. H]VFJ97841.1 MAG: Putative Zn-dependent protease [Candidatus Kentron sp. H]